MRKLLLYSSVLFIFFGCERNPLEDDGVTFIENKIVIKDIDVDEELSKKAGRPICRFLIGNEDVDAWDKWSCIYGNCKGKSIGESVNITFGNQKSPKKIDLNELLK